MTPIKLSRLLYNLYDTTLYSDVEISGLALDSRKVKPGDLFFACKGSQHDGRKFIDEAVNKGAKAILAEVDSATIPIKNYHNIPILPVDRLSQRMGVVAAEFYGRPSEKLNVVGITGTNGKTSCSYFLAQALHYCQIESGVIGTLGSGLYGKIKEGHLTTPDALTLQGLFFEFLNQNVHTVAMEVSSHSIDQGRINGIDFDIAIFTNLTRDHLDYHGSMEAYGQTKRKLFSSAYTRQAVINSDDAFGREMLTDIPLKNKYAYGLEASLLPKNISKEFSIVADQVGLDTTGIQARVHTPWGTGDLMTPLIGQFNLSNVLATLTALCLLEIPFSQALQSLSHLSSVPGRMQTVNLKNNPLIVVDYAHTPDALEKVLLALRRHCQGKLLCLFGCGGDRDTGKRPLMAKVVEQYADFVMVTDDNPRTEDPVQIVKDIVKGFNHPEKVSVQHNRSKAIRDIIQYAQVTDCVLIAGKGAETYQQIGHEKIPFSDIQKIMESLNAGMVE